LKLIFFARTKIYVFGVRFSKDLCIWFLRDKFFGFGSRGVFWIRIKEVGFPDPENCTQFSGSGPGKENA